MLVRQVTAQVFGCDIKGVEIQITVDEAADIMLVLQRGINSDNANFGANASQRALALFNLVSDAVSNK